MSETDKQKRGIGPPGINLMGFDPVGLEAEDAKAIEAHRARRFDSGVSPIEVEEVPPADQLDDL